MQTRTYGRLWLEGDSWKMKCEPHVALWAKRIFRRIPATAQGVFSLSNTPAVCRDLEWMLQRFPLDIDHPQQLANGAKAHVDRIARLDRLIDPHYKPRSFDLAVRPRDYQRRAAEVYLANGSLLLADDVGLGKTCSAICSLTDPATLPAVVVCMAHLPKQWEREINRFAPDLRTHVLKRGTPYELPKFMGRGPDVVLCSYHKLAGWASVLSAYCKSVIFDEVQELRSGTSTQKGAAAKEVADQVDYRLGLSATPIYNFGGEIFNILDILAPGSLGSFAEFSQEWCVGNVDKLRLKDPAAFGAWLRESHLMLRRTRRDVGRELPPLSTVVHHVDSDEKAMKAIEGKAGDLARLILAETESVRGQKMQAAEEFNALLRQATGIAKAPYVAAFADMVIQGGEPVVLFGWHRAVYEIWRERLKHHNPAVYTGSESAGQKEAAARAFISGETDLLIISLRSGAGLDGLQNRCRTVLFGELDWSPGVHEQCIGRVARDGQADPVAAYYLLSDSGVDPFIAETLGLKRSQIDGIRGGVDVGPQRVDSSSVLKKLAEVYLRRAR